MKTTLSTADGQPSVTGPMQRHRLDLFALIAGIVVTTAGIVSLLIQAGTVTLDPEAVIGIAVGSVAVSVAAAVTIAVARRAGTISREGD